MTLDLLKHLAGVELRAQGFDAIAVDLDVTDAARVTARHRCGAVLRFPVPILRAIDAMRAVDKYIEALDSHGCYCVTVPPRRERDERGALADGQELEPEDPDDIKCPMCERAHYNCQCTGAIDVMRDMFERGNRS